jgi:hypothetical protein
MAEDSGVDQIPKDVRRTLEAQGINLDDSDVRRMVLLTLEAIRGPSFWAALHAYRRGFLRGLTKELELTAERTSRLAGRLASAMIVAGIFAAAATLVSGFEPFRESLMSIISRPDELCARIAHLHEHHSAQVTGCASLRSIQATGLLHSVRALSSKELHSGFYPRAKKLTINF